jgi:hypothetical protein
VSAAERLVNRIRKAAPVPSEISVFMLALACRSAFHAAVIKGRAGVEDHRQRQHQLDPRGGVRHPQHHYRHRENNGHNQARR